MSTLNIYVCFYEEIRKYLPDISYLKLCFNFVSVSNKSQNRMLNFYCEEQKS